jgi:hypothetical protein
MILARSRMPHNSDIEADVALGRSAPSGPRSLMPVVMQTAVHTWVPIEDWTNLWNFCWTFQVRRGPVLGPLMAQHEAAGPSVRDLTGGACPELSSTTGSSRWSGRDYLDTTPSGSRTGALSQRAAGQVVACSFVALPGIVFAPTRLDRNLGDCASLPCSLRARQLWEVVTSSRGGSARVICFRWRPDHRRTNSDGPAGDFRIATWETVHRCLVRCAQGSCGRL